MNPWKDPNSSTKKPAPTVPTIAAKVPAVRHIPINKMYTVRNDFGKMFQDPLLIPRPISFQMVQISYLYLTNSGNQCLLKENSKVYHVAHRNILEQFPETTKEYKCQRNSRYVHYKINHTIDYLKIDKKPQVAEWFKPDG